MHAFFFQAEDGIRDSSVTGVQTCALPICQEGELAANGAFAAMTGSHTGRSPKDKYIVSNEEYATKIWWGEINHPISAETFERIRRSLAAYLQGRDVYVLNAAAAADPAYRIPIQVITELAWHNLFALQLFFLATP